MKRVCFTADEANGLDSVMSYHFGHCPYFVIVDVEGNEVRSVKSITNPLGGEHNPGDLPTFMKEQGVNVIITGGMGPKAQEYFKNFGIEPVIGAYGKVKDVLEEYLHGKVNYNPIETTETEKKEGEESEIERLKKEVVALRKQLADLKSMLKK